MQEDKLIAQYNKWVYPQPIKDLDHYARLGGHDLSDPARMRRKLWRKAIEPTVMQILVAGCGANQAAIIAHANPSCQVTGIDLSDKAVAHHLYLKEQHHLHNMEIRQISVESVKDLGRHFDYIISTGVLHHLRNPLTGLIALRDVLAPHGAISVMLYSRHRRAGVYMLQEAFRTIGVAQSPVGIAFARETVENLPSWHLAKSYLDVAPDLGYDAGFVDTLLNARDSAFTVPDIMKLSRDAGMEFQSWLDGLYYSPAAAFPHDAGIHERIEHLPREDQWHIVDLLTCATGAHRFILCHPGGSDLKNESSLLDLILHKHPDLKCEPADDGGVLKREWHAFHLQEPVYSIIQHIDGKTDVATLIADITDTDTREYACAVFEQMIEWDHLFGQSL